MSNIIVTGSGRRYARTLTARIPERLRARLDRLADRRCRTPADIVREALSVYLDTQDGEEAGQ